MNTYRKLVRGTSGLVLISVWFLCGFFFLSFSADLSDLKTFVFSLKISVPFSTAFGADTEGSQWIVGYLLQKVLNNLSVCSSEQGLADDTVQLLVTLGERRARWADADLRHCRLSSACQVRRDFPTDGQSPGPEVQGDPAVLEQCLKRVPALGPLTGTVHVLLGTWLPSRRWAGFIYIYSRSPLLAPIPELRLLSDEGAGAQVRCAWIIHKPPPHPSPVHGKMIFHETGP